MNSLSLESRIFIAGHRGMVGSALARRLAEKGYKNLLTVTRDVVDLTDQLQVRAFLAYRIASSLLLPKAGGTHVNNAFRSEATFENRTIRADLLFSAHLIDAYLSKD